MMQALSSLWTCMIHDLTSPIGMGGVLRQSDGGAS